LMTKGMTPFRKTQGGVFAGDNEEPASGVRLFGAPDHDGDEHMDSMSPPRVSKNNGDLPTTDLFGNRNMNGTTTTTINSRTGRRRRLRTRLSASPDGSFISDVSVDDTILRNMDMNASSPSSSASRRKRPSDHHPAGREELMDESDEDDMFVSPRVSPSFRTMDGRTVTSKNPFSPYTPTHDEDCMNPDMETAPTFPVTLPGSHSFDSTDPNHRETGLRPKLSMLRRDASAFAPQLSAAHAAAARAGYPDQHGRYSFTGSPIEEIDIMEHDSNMGSKIRRLTLSESASSAAHSLFVDTTRDANNTTFDDGISPADVMNFPTPPSAPKKAARPRYTPLKAAPPQTPMPARRNVARRPHEEEDDEEMSDAPKSRFFQDFDIIGELGTGSFGTVFKCLSRLDGCMYAVKAAKRKAKGNADRDRMLKEVCIDECGDDVYRVVFMLKNLELTL